MRKGSILDIPILMGVIFGAAVVFLIVSTIFSQIDGQIDGIVSVDAANTFHDIKNNTVSLLDGLTVFTFFGLGIVSLYLASLTKSTPILLAVGIVIVMLSVFIAPTIANTYTAIAESAGITATSTNIDAFFNNLPVIILLFGAAMLIIMAYGGNGSA